MFSNEGEKKLDWMYKGPNALVDREDYLLGRTIDKTLEQLNDEEKKKASNQLLAPPKNHVEHECIPPSIRDYNKIVQNEQVDLQAKLQEDPLVLIKRQEEETRRQFLQNPIQLKKLQEAMQAQIKRKKRKKGESDIDRKLKKKLKLLNKQLKKKGGYKSLEITEQTNDEEILDTILMHKFNMLKDKLSEDDLRNIVMGDCTEDDPSTSEKEFQYFKSLNLNKKREDPKNKIKTLEQKLTQNKEAPSKKSNKKLSEEEKEALRKSMMEKAAERSKESSKTYKKYKEEQSKPEKISEYSDEFMRREFLKSANSSSVADRIKSNLNNIQRSKFAMETNFLK